MHIHSLPTIYNLYTLLYPMMLDPSVEAYHR